MSVPWVGRQPDEPTANYLGRVLEDYAGLPELADQARRFHFDDYFCPPEVDDGMNLHRLVAALLRSENGASSAQRARTRAVIDAVKAGEFDGTKAESDAWARSSAGQSTFRDLLGGR